MIWSIIKLAFDSLLINKLRSFLAMLGIIIGVGSVIAMISIGQGARKYILDEVNAMGSNLLMIRPGSANSGGGVVAGSRRSLKMTDAQAIMNKINDVQEVSPFVSGSYQIKYFEKNTNSEVTGIASTYFSINNEKIEKGRFFDEQESEGMARIAIVKTEVVKELFEDIDPIDETIKVNGMSFKIIGTVKSKGDNDKDIYIPYKLAMKQVVGVDFLRGIDIKTSEKSNIDEVQSQVERLLRRRHKIIDDKPDDFRIFNQAQILEQASSFTIIFTALLGGIAGISLLVGGIGIMNIMLVTVTERTREIGIRKAIGAKKDHILKQFLIESVVLTTLGGLMGIVFGYSVSKIIGMFTPFPPLVTISSVIISIGFSMAVGIFFGYYPARNAAKLDPIEALRYE
jgi:putative ABC transport system permease protein